jgi:6-phosphogluconolactonase
MSMNAVGASQRVIVFGDPEALMEGATEHIVALAARAIAQQGSFSWALSGGGTPNRLYELLASERFRRRIAWERVHLFWGDERCVPPDHAESNYGRVKAALLDVVQPRTENVHRLRGEDAPIRAAESYEQILREHLATRGGGARLDLVLLGMGADGHTASLFPGSTALEETTRWVVATQQDSASRRLTMTPLFINTAAQIVFLVAGADKADRLVEALREKPADRDPLPVQLIRPSDGEAVWFVDAEAARQLEPARPDVT